MQKNINSKEELEQLSPLLNSLQKPARPSVPELYFEGFSTRLFRKIGAEADDPIEIFPKDNIFKRIKQWIMFPGMSVALVVLLLLVSTWVFYPKFSDNLQTSMNNIGEQEVYSYINENIDQFDANSLVGNELDDQIADQVMHELVDQNELMKALDENVESIDLEDLL